MQLDTEIQILVWAIYVNRIMAKDDFNNLQKIFRQYPKKQCKVFLFNPSYRVFARSLFTKFYLQL